MRYAANAPCTAEFVIVKLCFVDPLLHAPGTVGTCYAFGSKTAHRNDGEIDFTIAMALAEGAGFYRLLIADTVDANLRAFSGHIELVGVVAEGASVPPTPAPAAQENASEKDSSLITALVVALATVSTAMICLVLILFANGIIAVICCAQRRKDAAVNDMDDDSELSDDGVVFSQGGIEMAEMNPLATAKLATERLEREAAAKGRERRKSTLLQSDSETESERLARRTARRAKKKERLDESNKAIFRTGTVAV